MNESDKESTKRAGRARDQRRGDEASTAATKIESEAAGPQAGEGRASDKRAEGSRGTAALGRRPAAIAAGIALAFGVGATAGWAMAARPAAHPVQAALVATDWNALAAGLQQSQGDAARLGGDVRTLKAAVEALKEGIERSKQDAASRLAQVGAQVERAQRADAEVAGKVAGLAERIERADGDKLGPVVERLERIEKLVASAPVRPTPAVAAAPAPVAASPSHGPDTPAQTGAIPERKEPPKPAVLEGWVLREVYNGLALVEGRNQRLLEIGPGEVLPGVGRVEAIERRGKTWVVVTGKGLITSQQW